MSKESHKKLSSEVALSLILLLFLGFLTFYFFSKNKTKNVKLDESSIIENAPKEEKLPENLIGRAELSYAGGTAGRMKNIELGLERINGTVIPAGEEFSFIKAMGEVKVEDGFSEERAFVSGEVALGLGGGLCQVSTVLFQSLIDAGLPITERHNHTYSVNYYKEGLDAAFASPGPDLRFVNDTGSPVVIKGRNENKTAIFEIYGVSDGRVSTTSEVEVYNIVDAPPIKYVQVPALEEGKPECENARQMGYSTKVKYSVTFPDGSIKEQVFTSRYKPLERKCYVVTGNSTSTLTTLSNINP